MNCYQPEDDGLDHTDPGCAHVVFVLLGIFAAIGQAIVAVLLIGLQVQKHDFQRTAQGNQAAATSQTAAAAETFYRDLLAATKSATPTQSEIRALGRRDRVSTDSPVVHDGSIVVAFEARQPYVEPNLFGADQGTVQLCYSASVPLAPATTPPAALRQTACPAGGV